jgi:hypothetical protein
VPRTHSTASAVRAVGSGEPLISRVRRGSTRGRARRRSVHPGRKQAVEEAAFKKNDKSESPASGSFPFSETSYRTDPIFSATRTGKQSRSRMAAAARSLGRARRAIAREPSFRSAPVCVRRTLREPRHDELRGERRQGAGRVGDAPEGGADRRPGARLAGTRWFFAGRREKKCPKPRQDRASASASSASPLEARRPGRRLLSPSSTSDSATPDSSPSLTRW